MVGRRGEVVEDAVEGERIGPRSEQRNHCTGCGVRRGGDRGDGRLWGPLVDEMEIASSALLTARLWTFPALPWSTTGPAGLGEFCKSNGSLTGRR